MNKVKIFISADIEGGAGFAFREEGRKDQDIYKAMAAEMTKEVVTACEAAHAAGVNEIVVKDGHGNAGNIDPSQMPDYVTLIRGKSGHPYNMMYGIDKSFDGVFYIGYHASAGNPGFSVSHTSTGNSLYIKLNGEELSEFKLNSYTAGDNGVPVLFISGDAAVCKLAGEMVPAITANITKSGVGGATYCVPQGKVLEGIRQGVTKALKQDKKKCLIKMPKSFTYQVTFKDWQRAYTMSFYPGMKQLDTFTDQLVVKKWLDIVTAHCFVVY